MARTIKIVSTILAVLCLVALPLWILGIPGVENDYARGWKLGLGALVALPLVHQLLGLLESLARHGRLALQHRWITWLRLVALLAFAAAQIAAWPLILR